MAPGGRGIASQCCNATTAHLDNLGSSISQIQKEKKPKIVTLPMTQTHNPVATSGITQHLTTASGDCEIMASQCSKAPKERLGYLGSSISKTQKKREPEIVTITSPSIQTHQPVTTSGTTQHQATASDDSKKNDPAKTSSKSPEQGRSTSWEDKLLKKRPRKGGSTILWHPGSGRHVSEGANSYKPFTLIVRTLHLEDAVTVCTTQRIEPKNVITFSSIDSRQLPPTHPCADLKVLWFSTCFTDQDEDIPDWYGNVEFGVNAKILLEQWKYSFLVEMVTTPTHTASRILLTNTDYSSVLPHYDRYREGGPWQVTSEGQYALITCSRFRFRGTNRHEHILEFMLDVTPKDENEILRKCKISFRNHEEAQDMTTPHVCNRYQRAGLPCPTPFPRATAATYFFQMLQQNNVYLNISKPKLSKSAQQYLQSFLEEEKMKKNFMTLHNILRTYWQ